ncbi:redoxin domain-containing protein [Thalassoroseus pseudoceratinae]|uniref:redoxin domain-containing protein n=1 Tax=Thalassoroseus pseudoceratinae TaxID=2713176 RepID=UPI00141F1522|nr:redoxin domain-containing protein [Thalassoroseus pseudoceratinae]
MQFDRSFFPRSWRVRTAGALALAVSTMTMASAAEPPSAKLALSFKPTQKDIEIDTPTGDDVADCRVKVERKGKRSGWVVYGPQGQVLRRFMDTDGDNVVDQWQYFHQGLEVYRDIDANNNNKVDQSRWLNTAGTRWGLDTNEDGQIDEWKILSAEEAARIAVTALIDGDATRLQSVLITPSELQRLGVQKKLADEILKLVAKPAETLQKIRSRSQLISPQTQWMRFDSANPGLIPADEDKANEDLVVYENAMGIVEAGDRAGLVQIGEMVRVGNVWKLTQVPEPIEGDSAQVAAGGVLMQPSSVIPGGGAPIDGYNERTRELLVKLQEIDSQAPAPTEGAKAVADYNRRRADVLDQLVEAADSPQEREQWQRQLVDGLAAAVQTGQFKEGLERLQKINSGLQKQNASDELMAYVGYRTLLSRYAMDLQSAITNEEQRSDVQKWWLEQLQNFAKRYPQAEETAEAMLQLAVSNEFAGDIEAAKQWYQRTASQHSKTDPGQRSAGALRRLNLEGKRLELSGKGLAGGTVDISNYQGKPVLVIFWSTWAKLAEEDLPQIQSLYQQYHQRGFEVIGVNLDATAAPVAPFVKANNMQWPQIFEAGGLESRLAKDYGIISLPTMFLVDKQGEVVSRNIGVDQLKNEVPKLLLQ